MYLAKIVCFFLNSLCYWFLSCVLKSFCLFQKIFNLQLWGPCSGFVRVLVFAVFHCWARGKKVMELQLTRTPRTSALFAYRDCIWDVQMSHGTEDSGVELLLKIRASPSVSWLPEGVEDRFDSDLHCDIMMFFFAGVEKWEEEGRERWACGSYDIFHHGTRGTRLGLDRNVSAVVLLAFFPARALLCAQASAGVTEGSWSAGGCLWQRVGPAVGWPGKLPLHRKARCF